MERRVPSGAVAHHRVQDGEQLAQVLEVLFGELVQIPMHVHDVGNCSGYMVGRRRRVRLEEAPQINGLLAQITTLQDVCECLSRGA